MRLPSFNATCRLNPEPKPQARPVTPQITPLRGRRHLEGALPPEVQAWRALGAPHTAISPCITKAAPVPADLRPQGSLTE